MRANHKIYQKTDIYNKYLNDNIKSDNKLDFSKVRSMNITEERYYSWHHAVQNSKVKFATVFAEILHTLFKRHDWSLNSSETYILYFIVERTLRYKKHVELITKKHFVHGVYSEEGHKGLGNLYDERTLKRGLSKLLDLGIIFKFDPRSDVKQNWDNTFFGYYTLNLDALGIEKFYINR
jgi:hypothetical protein